MQKREPDVVVYNFNAEKKKNNPGIVVCACHQNPRHAGMDGLWGLRTPWPPESAAVSKRTCLKHVHIHNSFLFAWCPPPVTRTAAVIALQPWHLVYCYIAALTVRSALMIDHLFLSHSAAWAKLPAHPKVRPM